MTEAHTDKLDEAAETFFRSMKWSDVATDHEMTLVRGNIHSFVAFMRQNMEAVPKLLPKFDLKTRPGEAYHFGVSVPDVLATMADLSVRLTEQNAIPIGMTMLHDFEQADYATKTLVIKFCERLTPKEK